MGTSASVMAPLITFDVFLLLQKTFSSFPRARIGYEIGAIINTPCREGSGGQWRPKLLTIFSFL